MSGHADNRANVQEQKKTAAPLIELWGGYECTVNRVGDRWFDQTMRSGHEHRIGDLDLFADLGVKSLRYPALWERISPDSPDVRDFSWTDERLNRIRELGMDPIVTLCHHGSGPHWTNLLDDGFAPGLASHAAAVAQRYPWVTDYTPVNEILTTARFSALYGYWYPHTTDEGAFWVALLNEVDATRLAMREIRKVNAGARLIQTDDLGFCHATPPLQAEADYQNERRWMGWDLLCGMVRPGHPLWERLIGHGLQDRLYEIADDPCPPAVIGVNHYLASERLLDHRVDRHLDRALADRELGSCDGVSFVDVDAVRSRPDQLVGLPRLLEEAALRYGLPVAVTECHNGASRDEQVRWFVEVWRGVEELRRQGVDILAVTAWSLLGSHDWNRMVTRFIGHYEVGVFDIRSGEPRPTLMAHVLKALAAGRQPDVPGLSEPGWWRRSPGQSYDLAPAERDKSAAKPLLIVGCDGPLLQLIVRACNVRALHYVRLEQVTAEILKELGPWAVIDGRDWAGICDEWAAAYPAHHWDGRSSWSLLAPPETLVSMCARSSVPCCVFSAHSGWEDVEDNLLALGGDKLLVAQCGPVIIPWDRSRFAVKALDALDAGVPVRADVLTAWNYTYGPDLADVALDLLLDGVSGRVPLVGAELWSTADFLKCLAVTADCDPALVIADGEPIRFGTSSEATLLPPGETTLERFVRESRAARSEGICGVTRRRDETHQQSAA